MSKHKITQVADAVSTHLFLLCPNNSGSTYLSRAIARSRHVWSLEREGQHVLGFAGPQTLNSPWPLVWAADEERLAYFRDSQDYDWERTRRAWYFHATAARADAPVFHTKAPPFLMVADQLQTAFPDTRFIIMVRNPYATLEGILRRWQRTDASARTLDLAQAGARHIVACLAQQLRNIERFKDCATAFTYEDLCNDPRGKAEEIRALVPQLDDLDLSPRLAIKGTYDEPLRNMNAEQIDRLLPAEIETANRVLKHDRSILERFGYALID
jgi:Sulfotransferase family